jgi:hypothetical protein
MKYARCHIFIVYAGLVASTSANLNGLMNPIFAAPSVIFESVKIK